MADSKPTQENVERALAWMRQQCRAADGPRFPAAGEEDVPGEPHCDCPESLAAEFSASDAIARRRALEEATASLDAYADWMSDENSRGGHINPDIIRTIRYAANMKIRNILCAPTSEKTSVAPEEECLETRRRSGADEPALTRAPTSDPCRCDGENGYFACPVHRVRISRDPRLNMAIAAMRTWEEQLAQDDGSFGLAEVREAIRATLAAIRAPTSEKAEETRATCDTPECGRPIPKGGEGYPEICPVCLAALRMHERACSPTADGGGG